MTTYTPAETKMAVDMFLGISSGLWEATEVPTERSAALALRYMGDKPKPFKLLYAAVRPPKNFRPTSYYTRFEVDLFDKTIEMYGLKGNTPDEVDETKARLLKDWNTCLENARIIIKHRAEATSTAYPPVNTKEKLRRLADRIARRLANS